MMYYDGKDFLNDGIFMCEIDSFYVLPMGSEAMPVHCQGVPICDRC
jgi:hypothetical protein